MPQELGFFESLFQGSGQTEALSLREILIRLGGAALFGAAAAVLHRWSCRYREGAPGLGSTLMLLSILIAMVTMAIGDQAAKAFTLVGTLAIVRFRTPVRDIRDTAFVILSVGLGLAMGAGAYRVAIFGTILVAAVVVALTFWSASRGRHGDGDDWARLEVRIDAVPDGASRVEQILDSVHTAYRLVSARRGAGEPTRLLYAIRLPDRARVPQLLDALHGALPLRRAVISFAEDDEPPAFEGR